MQFIVKVRPVGTPKAFLDIEVGESFTVVGDICMGDVFVGFPIYLKIGGDSGRNISDGRLKVFAANHPVVRVWIGEVSR